MSDFCLKHGPLSGCEGCSDERHETRITELEAKLAAYNDLLGQIFDFQSGNVCMDAAVLEIWGDKVVELLTTTGDKND